MCARNFLYGSAILQKYCAEERHWTKINFIYKSVEAGLSPVAHIKLGNSTETFGKADCILSGRLQL